MIHLLIWFIALEIFIALPDHRDGEDYDERSPGSDWWEWTDDGDGLQNGNEQEVDVGEPLKLNQQGFWNKMQKYWAGSYTMYISKFWQSYSKIWSYFVRVRPGPRTRNHREWGI